MQLALVDNVLSPTLDGKAAGQRQKLSSFRLRFHPAHVICQTQEFYQFATTRLSPGGLLVTQSGAAAVHLKDECFTVIHKTLQSVFKHVAASVADIPSFGCCWGFNLASDSEGLNTDVRNAMSLLSNFFAHIQRLDGHFERRLLGDIRAYEGQIESYPWSCNDVVRQSCGLRFLMLHFLPIFVFKAARFPRRLWLY